MSDVFLAFLTTLIFYMPGKTSEPAPLYENWKFVDSNWRYSGEITMTYRNWASFVTVYRKEYFFIQIYEQQHELVRIILVEHF